MIRSAVDRHVESADVFETHKDSIAFHALNEDEGEVAFIFADNNKTFETHVLHHFAAVNHTQKSIILAIRGTLSLSGAIVDIQGMAGKRNRWFNVLSFSISDGKNGFRQLITVRGELTRVWQRWQTISGIVQAKRSPN